MNGRWYWHSATHRWSKVNPPWGVILRDVQSMVTSSTSSVGAYSNTPQLTKPPPASGAAHPPASPPPPPPTSPPASGAAPPPPTTPPAADGAAWPPTKSTPPTQCCHSSHDWPAASSLDCLINSYYNLVTGDIQPMLSCMDNTLFRGEKRGWDACQDIMTRAKARKQMSYAWMSTTGKYRGFAAVCHSCQRVCGVERPKWTTEATTAEMRNRWLNFHDVPSPSSTDPPVR